MQGPTRVAARRLVKRAVIQGGLEAVSLAASSGLFRSSRGMGAIFTLHHVRPASNNSFDPAAHLSVTPEFLDATITSLKASGHVPVALEDLPAHLQSGDASRPAMVFTLDDGYRDNAVHARPVFEKHAIPYTIFVAGGFVDRTHSIWWETAEAVISKVDGFDFDFGDGDGAVSMPARSLREKYAVFDRLHKALACAAQGPVVARLDELARSHGICPVGIVDREVMDEGELRQLIASPLARLGSHTISHCNLAHVDAGQLRDEIAQSRDRVSRITGSRPTTFAYPYGDRCSTGPREYEATRDMGFRLAVTTMPGVLKRSDLKALHSLRRISLNGYYQKTRYVDALASGIPFRFSPQRI